MSGVVEAWFREPVGFLGPGSAFCEEVFWLFVIAAVAFAVAAADVISERLTGLGIDVSDESHMSAGGAALLSVVSTAMFQCVSIFLVSVLHCISVCYQVKG